MCSLGHVSQCRSNAGTPAGPGQANKGKARQAWPRCNRHQGSYCTYTACQPSPHERVASPAVATRLPVTGAPVMVAPSGRSRHSTVNFTPGGTNTCVTCRHPGMV